jgi:glycosyltransferase involved in cell wall biosynthesis
MDPDKILFFITKATRGGAQKYLYDLATHLPDTFEPVVAYGEKGRLANDLEAAHIRTVQIAALGRNVALVADIASFIRMMRLLRAERPAVVHLNSSKAAALGAVAARLAGSARIVFTVHGWPFKESRNPLSRALIYAASWLTAFLSDRVIVVSKADEALGKRMWGCADKVAYIPLGIRMPRFLSREEAGKELGIETALPRIVTNAELTKNKGIRYAIEALALLKKEGVRASYCVISDGEDRQALEALAEKRGLAEEVRFLGFVPEAARYLKAFDVFLLPSIKEGMPYVLLEAAAAELPIVATNVVDPLFLGTYQDVRVAPPADSAALAAALLATMQRRSERPLFPAAKDDALARMVEATAALYAPAQAA